MKVSPEELRRVMREKTGEELWSILSVRTLDYTAEAMKAAREEGQRRGWGEGPITRPASQNNISGVGERRSEPVPTIAARDYAGSSGGEFLVLVALIGAPGWLWWQTRPLRDEAGWVQHSHDTPVWIKGEWLAGEYRVCQMPTPSTRSLLPESAHLLCAQGSLDDQAFLSGLNEEERLAYFARDWTPLNHRFHILSVLYWGRIDRSDRAIAQFHLWRCMRRDYALTCWALN